jgi:hypothetical protein
LIERDVGTEGLSCLFQDPYNNVDRPIATAAAAFLFRLFEGLLQGIIPETARLGTWHVF